MSEDNFLSDFFNSRKFSFKRFFQPIVASGVMAVFLLILIWVFEYLNADLDNFVIFHLHAFFVYNWFYIAGFVLIIGVWDYLYKTFKDSFLRYLSPIFDAFGVFFAIWIIGVILNGLRIFIESESQLHIFFSFLYDLFYSQTILLAILLVLIYYSKFFLKER